MTSYLPELIGHHQYDNLKKTQVTTGPLTIFLSGSTGVGKSSLGSFLISPTNPTRFPHSQSSKAVTKDVTCETYLHESCLWLHKDEVRQYEVQLFDAPGLNDASDRGVDLQHIYNFVAAIKSCRLLHSLVFVTRMGRFDAQFKATLKYCCTELFTNLPPFFIKIVFTYLDKETFKDWQADEELFNQKIEEDIPELKEFLGNKAIRFYYMHTGRKPKIQDNAMLYLETCRSNNGLTPKDGTKSQFEVENIDVHALYIRDKIIDDIYEDTKGFIWKNTTVRVPPSIEADRAKALVKLYQKKCRKTATMPDVKDLYDAINMKQKERGKIDDTIAKMKDQHLDLEKYASKPVSHSGQCKITRPAHHRPVFWQDCSQGGVISQCIPSYKNDEVTFSVQFDLRSKKGTLIMQFHVPGDVVHAEALRALTEARRDVSEQIDQL